MGPEGESRAHRRSLVRSMLYAVALISLGGAMFSMAAISKPSRHHKPKATPGRAAQALFRQGRTIFRHDTFGDEAFWGGTLQLHRAVEGAAHGGVGPGVSPKTALSVGLKV